MNERRILEMYPPGDPEARMLVAASQQLEAVLASVITWSDSLGAQLMMLLSSRRLEFSDGTVLGDPESFQSYIGNREAAFIVAALDPLDRGSAFWHRAHAFDYSSSEMVDMEARLPSALKAAGIKLDG